MMNNDPVPANYYEEDELRLKDVLLKLKVYVDELRRSWKLLLLCTLPLTFLWGYKAWVKPVTYTANLTFMLNEDKGGGGISSLLGQFGGLFGSSGRNDYQLEKILEIARSRRIITEALFEKASVNGQEDYYANHIIRAQQMHKRWEDDGDLQQFLFTHSDQAKFSLKENKAMLALYAEFVGGEGVDRPLLGAGLNDDTGIMTFSLATTDEMLSIALLNTLYEKVSSFYISKSIEQESNTLAILIQKRDSIARALYKNDYSQANFEDKSYGVLLQQDKTPGKRYQRNNQVLSVVYGEAVKNVEMAEFALKSSTPFLSYLDVPVAPIKADPRGRAKALLSGFFIGLVAGMAYVLGRKVIRDALSD